MNSLYYTKKTNMTELKFKKDFLNLLKKKDLKIEKLENELKTLRKNNEKIDLVKMDPKIKDFLSYECTVGDMNTENYFSALNYIKDKFLEGQCINESELKDCEYDAASLASWYMESSSFDVNNSSLQSVYDNLVYKFEDKEYEELIKAIDRAIKSL